MSSPTIKYHIDDIKTVALSIIRSAGASRTFLFHGEMGAGKTTLIKALCKVLGTRENISSPTFSIVNEYLIPKGKIYHFDFYRLRNATEALDMGYEEYFYSGEYCFIEWPEMIAGLLPKNYTDIAIRVLSANERQIHVANI